METHGMRWGDLSDSMNGMKEVFIIILVEWTVVLLVAYYADQVASSGGGKSPLFFLQNFWKKPLPSFKRPSLQRQGSKVFVDMNKPDVCQEVTFTFSSLYLSFIYSLEVREGAGKHSVEKKIYHKLKW